MYERKPSKMRKLNSMQKITLIILSFLFVAAAYGDEAMHRDPNYVLESAREHVEKKRYAEALKDYQWFYNNSTEINESLWAVKLSYCLNEWRALGNIYEPALTEFRKELSTRKERLEKGEADVWLFIEYNAFCLSDDKKAEAVDMFMSFHNGKNKGLAKAIFPQIQFELAEMGYYSVCSEYIKDPIQSLNRVRPLYSLDVESFNREMLFLLTVLKKNNRNVEYAQLKAKIAELNPSEKFNNEINELEKPGQAERPGK
jgi:hypothetical protein